MIRRWTSFLAIAACLSASVAAAATPPPAAGGDPDLKCLLVASALSQNPDPKARTISGLMVFYYMGHLDARKPGINLRAALEAQAQAVTPPQLQAEAQRCVTTVSARGQLLQSMSKPPAQPPGATAPAPAAPPATPAPH